MNISLNISLNIYMNFSSYMNIFATVWLPKDCWSKKWTNKKIIGGKHLGTKTLTDLQKSWRTIRTSVCVEGSRVAVRPFLSTVIRWRKLYCLVIPSLTSHYGVIQCPGSPESGKVEKCNKIQQRCFIILADHHSICWNTRQTLCLTGAIKPWEPVLPKHFPHCSPSAHGTPRLFVWGLLKGFSCILPALNNNTAKISTGSIKLIRLQPVFWGLMLCVWVCLACVFPLCRHVEQTLKQPSHKAALKLSCFNYS